MPGTGKIGLAIAAAAGAIGGNAEAGLEVLAAITPAQVAEAQELIDAGLVQVSRTSAPSSSIAGSACWALMQRAPSTAPR